MSLTLEEITQLPDPTTVLDDIDQYTATQFIRALRRSWALDPHKRVSYRLAENLHRRHPDDIVVTTVFTAVLKDVGELDRYVAAARDHDRARQFGKVESLVGKNAVLVPGKRQMGIWSGFGANSISAGGASR